MMLSFKARITRTMLSWKTQVFKEGGSLADARARLDQLGQSVPRAAGVSIEPVEIGSVHAEWVKPDSGADPAIILYLHGGGYTMGSSASHRNMLSQIVKIANIPALLPEYRLAPEYVFPAAIQDALATYRWLLDHGFSAERIAVVGDSAGGGLALSTFVSARDHGLQLPAAIALLSPWTDLTASGESITTCARKDPWLSKESLLASAASYYDDADGDDPLVSPLFADLHGLPPTLIQVGDHEILLDDSTRLAEKMSAAGVDARLRVWEGMWHVWHYLGNTMPESKAAIEEVAGFLHEHLGDAAEKPPG